MVGAVLWSDQMVVSQCKEEAGIPAVGGGFSMVHGSALRTQDSTVAERRPVAK